jgi:hypothetical protein
LHDGASHLTKRPLTSFPRPILAGEVSINIVGLIVKIESCVQVLSLTNVELPGWILGNIDPKRKLAPHTGHSAQLFLTANGRNAQVIPHGADAAL